KEARKYLEAAPSANAQVRLGDLYAEAKDWDAAAARYKSAWEKDRSLPLPLYLHGQALVKAGKDDEGKKLMDRAHWLPMGDEGGRTAFAQGLLRRAPAAEG